MEFRRDASMLNVSGLGMQVGKVQEGRPQQAALVPISWS